MSLSKETEDILKETSDLIAEQINLYDEQKKKDKENEVKEYFEELKKANNIDFLKYEQAKINVTLTASLKSLKEQAKGFIAEILDDLELINLQSHKEEILFEYKLNLNVTKSITMVSSRFEALEREKARQEELAKKKVEIAKLIIAEKTQEGQKNYEESFIPKEEKLQAPVVETQKVEEPIYTVKFAVKGTKTQLKELKEFLINGGYEYESIN